MVLGKESNIDCSETHMKHRERERKRRKKVRKRKKREIGGVFLTWKKRAKA